MNAKVSRLSTRCFLATCALATCVLATALFSSGCGDEAIEAALCKETASKACDKAYSCPLIAASLKWLYVDIDACKKTLSTTCSDSEAITGCDINNDRLRQCKSSLDTSTCTNWPADCTALLNCK